MHFCQGNARADIFSFILNLKPCKEYIKGGNVVLLFAFFEALLL